MRSLPLDSGAIQDLEAKGSPREAKKDVNDAQAPPSNPFAELHNSEVSMEVELGAEQQEGKAEVVSIKKGKSLAVKASRELTHCRIKAGTFNLANGLQAKVGELESYLAKKKFDVVALQECGKKTPVVKGYKAFCHPEGAVAILVAMRLVAFVAEVKSETKGQLWVRLTGSAGRKDIYVCSAYMLQESAKKEDREEAFGALKEAALRHGAKGELLLMGDLNARVGAPTSDLERKLIGRFGENGDRSDNGRLVLGMMKQVGLFNLGGQRSPPLGAAGDAKFWYTRFDPQRKVTHAIDYILITGGLKLHWSSFKVDYTHLGSDHHILMTEVTCPREIQKSKKREVKVCFQLEKFIQKSSRKDDVKKAQLERDAYERELVVAFKDFDPEQVDKEPKCDCHTLCACGSVKDFIQRTELALENSCGSKRIRKGFSRPWYDNEVKLLVDIRRKAHKEYVANPNVELWQQFTKARTRCGRAIKKKKTGLWQEFLDKFDDAYKGNHKMMWNLVHRLVPSSNKISIQPIKDKNGKLATSEQEIMEAWADHQSSLGTPSRHPLQDDQFTKEVEDEVVRLAEQAKEQGDFKLGMEITTAEIRDALDALDYYKAGAADGTKNPMFKCGGKTMEAMLYRLFNYLRKREIFPEDWGRSEVVNLFKEGDKSEPGNYRGTL
jgi:endonuclease/exonuclease/phosphatase family metal-dependent hydrolase